MPEEARGLAVEAAEVEVVVRAAVGVVVAAGPAEVVAEVVVAAVEVAVADRVAVEEVAAEGSMDGSSRVQPLCSSRQLGLARQG